MLIRISRHIFMFRSNALFFLADLNSILTYFFSGVYVFYEALFPRIMLIDPIIDAEDSLRQL